MKGIIVTRPLSCDSKRRVSESVLPQSSSTHIRGPVADFGDELAGLDVDHGQIVRISNQDELESIDCRTELCSGSALDQMGAWDGLAFSFEMMTCACIPTDDLLLPRETDRSDLSARDTLRLVGGLAGSRGESSSTGAADRFESSIARLVMEVMRLMSRSETRRTTGWILTSMLMT